MFYFSNFPLTVYNLNNSNRNDFKIVTDITKRFTIKDILGNYSASSFFEYYIEDGQRPDIIASIYYEDERLDWLVLLINEVYDPYFEWPMKADDFNQYIISRYGSIPNAYQTVHHYEQILNIQERVPTNNGNFISIPERTLIIDHDTYVGLAAYERKLVSVYDYEFDKNEKNKVTAIKAEALRTP